MEFSLAFRFAMRFAHDFRFIIVSGCRNDVVFIFVSARQAGMKRITFVLASGYKIRALSLHNAACRTSRFRQTCPLPEIVSRCVCVRVRIGMTAPFALVDSVSSIRTERIYNDVFITMTERVCRKPVEVDLASEFRYRKPIVGKNTLTIVISQSGETADTLAALREATRLGSRTLAVVFVDRARSRLHRVYPRVQSAYRARTHRRSSATFRLLRRRRQRPRHRQTAQPRKAGNSRMSYIRATRE